MGKSMNEENRMRMEAACPTDRKETAGDELHEECGVFACLGRAAKQTGGVAALYCGCYLLFCCGNAERGVSPASCTRGGGV